MNPSNLSLRQKSRGTVVKTIAIHLYGARDPNYIVDLTLSNLLWTVNSLGPRPSRDSLTKEGLWSVVLSQHVNVNCVIRPDNHVILYQFSSSISGLPVRACACRAALPLCHMIVSIQRSDWVTLCFRNMLTQHNRR